MKKIAILVLGIFFTFDIHAESREELKEELAGCVEILFNPGVPGGLTNSVSNLRPSVFILHNKHRTKENKKFWFMHSPGEIVRFVESLEIKEKKVLLTVMPFEMYSKDLRRVLADLKEICRKDDIQLYLAYGEPKEK